LSQPYTVQTHILITFSSINLAFAINSDLESYIEIFSLKLIIYAPTAIRLTKKLDDHGGCQKLSSKMVKKKSCNGFTHNPNNDQGWQLFMHNEETFLQNEAKI